MGTWRRTAAARGPAANAPKDIHIHRSLQPGTVPFYSRGLHSVIKLRILGGDTVLGHPVGPDVLSQVSSPERQRDLTHRGSRCDCRSRSLQGSRGIQGKHSGWCPTGKAVARPGASGRARPVDTLTAETGLGEYGDCTSPHTSQEDIRGGTGTTGMELIGKGGIQNLA